MLVILNYKNFHFILLFFPLVSVSWQAYNSLCTMQPFLKVHPPICRITAYATMPGSSFPQNFCSKLWSKWMVLEKWSPQWVFKLTALTTRQRLLAYLILLFVSQATWTSSCFFFIRSSLGVTSPMPIENPRFIMNQEAMRASRHMALNC